MCNNPFFTVYMTMKVVTMFYSMSSLSSKKVLYLYKRKSRTDSKVSYDITICYCNWYKITFPPKNIVHGIWTPDSSDDQSYSLQKEIDPEEPPATNMQLKPRWIQNLIGLTTRGLHLSWPMSLPPTTHPPITTTTNNVTPDDNPTLPTSTAPIVNHTTSTNTTSQITSLPASPTEATTTTVTISTPKGRAKYNYRRKRQNYIRPLTTPNLIYTYSLPPKTYVESRKAIKHTANTNRDRPTQDTYRQRGLSTKTQTQTLPFSSTTITTTPLPTATGDPITTDGTTQLHTTPTNTTIVTIHNQKSKTLTRKLAKKRAKDQPNTKTKPDKPILKTPTTPTPQSPSFTDDTKEHTDDDIYSLHPDPNSSGEDSNGTKDSDTGETQSEDCTSEDEDTDQRHSRKKNKSPTSQNSQDKHTLASILNKLIDKGNSQTHHKVDINRWGKDDKNTYLEFLQRFSEMSIDIPFTQRVHILESKLKDQSLLIRFYNIKQVLEQQHVNLTWPIFYEAINKVSEDFQSESDLSNAFLQHRQKENETLTEYFDVLLKLQTQHNKTSTTEKSLSIKCIAK
jgi:hypothetical protein